MVAQQTNVTAIARRDENTQVARTQSMPEMSFPQMVKMGEELVRTGFLPDHIKTGAQAAAIVLTGRELGMEPMRALRSLHMVKGKVVEDAASQLSRFKADGGHAKFVHLDDRKASIYLRHPNGDEHTETFTIEDAKGAGLTGDNWRKYPKAMLRSRVITAGLKSLGWEGGVGAYDPDEATAFTPAASTSSQEGAHVERDPEPVTDGRARIGELQQMARDEMDRLGIGEGMSKDEAKQARIETVRAQNEGKNPKTLPEWEGVVAALRDIATPVESGESQASDETPSP